MFSPLNLFQAYEKDPFRRSLFSEIVRNVAFNMLKFISRNLFFINELPENKADFI
jgi:hypothetical protein